MTSQVLIAPDTAPSPVFTITPQTGTRDTLFMFDASASTDLQDSEEQLEVRWDWENDGTFDTDWSTSKIESHQFINVGTETVTLEVRDLAGLTATTAKNVSVLLGWEAITSPVWQSLNDIYGTSPNNIIAVGGQAVMIRYDGTDWTQINSLPINQSSSLQSIWGTAPTDLYVSTTESLYRFSGGSEWEWMPEPATRAIRGIWGTSSSDIFAVGSGGEIMHYDGSSWNLMTSGVIDNLFGVFGFSANDVYVVGINGRVLHYNGTSWVAMQSGTSVDFNGVWGSSSSDVFAVGNHGTILHYDGNSWVIQRTGANESLYAVWGTGPDDVYAVGWPGRILHYNGNQWEQCQSGQTATLRGIWGASPTEYFIVGGEGLLLRSK